MSQPGVITQQNIEQKLNTSNYLSIGVDSIRIQESGVKAEQHFDLPMSRFMKSPVIKFNELKNKWLEDTELFSSVRDKAMHPAYQEIIGMGKIAIPMIMADLIMNNNHWFWALRSITGKNPVSPANRGKIKEMAFEWMWWWLENEEEY